MAIANDSASDSPVSLDDLFTAYDDDAVRRDIAEAAKVGGVRTVTLSKLEPGTYSFRVMPPKRGVKSPFHVAFKHFVKGGEKTRAVVCAKSMAGLPCGVCDEVDALKNTGNPTDAAVADDMKPTFSVTFAAIDEDLPVDPANPMSRFCVVEAKKQVHADLLKLHGNRAAGGDFSHPVKGFTIALTKTGSGMGTEYKVAAALSGIRPFDTQERMVQVLTEMPDISLRDPIPSAEEVEAVLIECGLRAPVAGSAPTAGSMLGRNFGAPAAAPRRR